MKNYKESGNIARSAAKSGMDRKTAGRYIHAEQLPPGEPGAGRHWRTHNDAFEDVWPEVENWLKREPGLQAKTLFDELKEKYPGRFNDSQRRSFERRVRTWKELHGPESERFFSQEHRPGERIQLDWFCARGLKVNIGGEAFDFKIVHTALPFSNWEWGRVCLSESFLSLKKGLQSALFTFGAVPLVCQTDNSSTATHARGKEQAGRCFNQRYMSLLDHYGMRPETIAIGKAHQNGDIESLNGSLKRALDQSLMLRGTRNFGSIEAFEGVLEEILEKRNEPRRQAAGLEKARMRALPCVRLPEYDEIEVRVSREGIARVGKQGYSVPARHIGNSLRARVSETEIAFYRGEEIVARTAKRSGDSGVYVNWRHVIGELVRKPGAFERWRHRESLFPGARWRRYYDNLVECGSRPRADREYINTLHLALEHGMEKVEEAIDVLGENASLGAIRRGLGANLLPEEPELSVDLGFYDSLLSVSSAQEKEAGHG